MAFSWWVSAPSAVQQPVRTERKIEILRGKPSFQLLPVPRWIIKDGEIQYGPTTLAADEITIYPDKAHSAGTESDLLGTGYAVGNVSLKDPLGSVSCVRLDFNWTDRTGTVQKAKVIIPDLKIDAERADASPNEITFFNMTARQSGILAGIRLKADKLTIRPGDAATAFEGELTAGSKSLFRFRHSSVNLDRKKLGFHMPYPSYDRQDGFGVTFNSSFQVDPLRVASVGFGAGQTGLPSYSLQLTSSLIDPAGVTGLISLKSMFDTRFTDSFMDDVQQRSPSQEADQLLERKSSVGLGTFWNYQPNDRLKADNFVVPFQFGLEQGGSLFGSGFLADAQLQDVRKIGSNDQIRLWGAQSYHVPGHRLWGNLFWNSRLDAQEFWGSGIYSWLRGMTSLSYEAGHGNRISIGFFKGQDFGTAQFTMDPLYANRGMVLRFDANMGSRVLSFLTKYDASRHQWYDQEIYFAQTAGLFEPFIVYRTFPSTLKFGMTIRFGSILQNLRNNSLQRPASKASIEL